MPAPTEGEGSMFSRHKWYGWIIIRISDAAIAVPDVHAGHNNNKEEAATERGEGTTQRGGGTRGGRF